ncbi:MAG: hypothetical protein H6697_12685 [Myxococcales bacterium]|nr:hypothetical protein [Myxococcales bacterium]
MPKDRSTPKSVSPQGNLAQPPTEPAPWKAHRTGGPPLRGWKAIVAEIGKEYSDSLRKALISMNEATNGPIVRVGRRWEVDPGELRAWTENAEARRDALERTRREEAAARKELDERGGVHTADVGMNHRRTPNAKTRLRTERR